MRTKAGSSFSSPPPLSAESGGLLLLSSDDEALDELEDTALRDKHERSGERRLEELGADTGVQARDALGLEDLDDGSDRRLVLVRGGLEARLDNKLVVS